jgi:hypothetical protein
MHPRAYFVTSCGGFTHAHGTLQAIQAASSEQEVTAEPFAVQGTPNLADDGLSDEVSKATRVMMKESDELTQNVEKNVD